MKKALAVLLMVLAFGLGALALTFTPAKLPVPPLAETALPKAAPPSEMTLSALPTGAMHSRAARAAGLAIDEVALAREFDSRDEREAALLRYLHALLRDGRPPMHLHEEAREAGWDDEQILEAIAALSLEAFTAMVNVAGEVPVDGSTEASRALEAA